MTWARKVVSVLVLIVLSPAAALACEQCLGIGGANGPTIRALVLSMASLLAIVGFVCTGISMFFVRVHRRSKMLEPGDLAVNQYGDLRPNTR